MKRGIRNSEFGMTGKRAGTRKRIPYSAFHLPHSGFTLVEIIIALTIVAVLAAAALPMLKGFRDERLAREPVAKLVQLAREARMRAMTEKRPYQVAFHSKGFTASRYFNPYLHLAELEDFLVTAQNPPPELTPFDKNDLDNGGSLTKTTELPLAPPAPKYDEYWSIKYDMPADVKYALQYWYDTEAQYVEGDAVKLWVFQPSGICTPLKIHIERESATFDVEFGALTADIIKESVNVR